METKQATTNITVQTTIKASINKVWNAWTDPNHIIQWNNASDDWYTPRAEVDLREGGRFLSRMESRDGKHGFDFTGTYGKIEENRLINYTMDDGRRVRVTFETNGNETTVRESYDTESTNPVEMQRAGWQAILDNFARYVESLLTLHTINFEILIHAPVENVYKTMIDKESYKEWTKAFNGSSHYEGSWEQGSKIRFIGTDDKGNIGGMVSRITENIPNKRVSIEHLGMILGDREITSGPEVEGWTGAMEIYTFVKEGNNTKLRIDLDVNKDFEQHMLDMWPKALEMLKKICEG